MIFFRLIISNRFVQFGIFAVLVIGGWYFYLLRHDAALIDDYENKQKIAISKKVADDEKTIEQNFNHVDSGVIASVDWMLDEASDAGELSGTGKNTVDAKKINASGIDMGASGRLSINAIITTTLDAEPLQDGCEMSELDIYSLLNPDVVYECLDNKWIISNE